MTLTKKIFFLINIFSAFAWTVNSQSIFQNVKNRNRTSLNGKWHYIIDPYETGFYDYRYIQYDSLTYRSEGAFYSNTNQRNKMHRVEYDFDKSPLINVPGDWNSQVEKLFYYEGTVWYKKSFKYEKKKLDNRVFLNFGAINYRADVYLNGKKLGFHEGGFTPFYFEITNLIKAGENFVIVKVDNKRKKEAIPTLNTDWWNYGGITRDVDLIETEAEYVADYLIQLSKDAENTLSGYLQLNGNDVSNRKVDLLIDELGIEKSLTTDKNGKANFTIKAKNIVYWSPENPKQYEVSIGLDQNILKDRIGFRSIATKGEDILLNKQPIFLRGISMHEEIPTDGRRAYSKEDARLLLGWAKELGCNFVRLAHYPHNENMTRMADEMGILLWEENPVYWTIEFSKPKTYLLAEKQLTDLIYRDKNRASVIIWSMANETPRSKERLDFLIRLANKTRSLDNSRLISAALEKNNVKGKENVLTIDDPFLKYVDILSFNQYVGWYDGLPDKCTKVKWALSFNKPVFISEFGAGALQGFHADSLTRWSEEYQEDLYVKSINMLKQIPQLRGMSPWILADFRSPKRMLPEIQDGWNRKGLISETGNKKKAFYVLKNYYQKVKESWEKSIR